MANTNVKDRSVFNKIVSILIDILVVPVMLIALVCAVLMTTAKANNKVPSFFGNSIVTVLTDSMKDCEYNDNRGYNPGDVLIINQSVKYEDLKVGDPIAFYAPIQSGFVTDDGNSLVIFHRIVRIVSVVEDGVPVRYFVCHGDSAGKLEFIPTTNKENNTPKEEWGGDYNEQGELEENGGYVVKLFDDGNVANQLNSVSDSQSVMQYVKEEFVVGKLKSKVNPVLSGIVKFCSSQEGIYILVIIPSVIMMAMVIYGIIQERKLAKKEKEDDQLVFAYNNSEEENDVVENISNKKVVNTQRKITTEDRVDETVQDKTLQNSRPIPNKVEPPKTPFAQKVEPPKTPVAPKPEIKSVNSQKLPEKSKTAPVVPNKAEPPKMPKQNGPQPTAPKAPPAKIPNVPPKKN